MISAPVLNGADSLGLSYVPYLPLDLGPRFPSADLVAAAAALISTDPRSRRDPGIRFRVWVAPGVVGLGEYGLPAPPGGADRADRSEVLGWSARSRVRMIRVLASLDYAPLFADSSRAAAMITLTLPGEWLQVAPTGRAFKRLVENWIKRYEKAWGEQLVCVWKLEFQARGAPHLHLFMAPPHGAALCRCRVCGRAGRALAFREWLSHSWAAVCRHPDPEHYRRHLLAGTGVDYREGHRAADPKRLAVYFAKHGGSGGGKEYQHSVPDEWRGPGNGPGRFWGVRRLRQAVAAVDVPPADWYRFRRVLRRWSERQAFYPAGQRYPSSVRLRTRVQLVARGGRTRRVTRRRRYLDGSGGGFVMPTNGPAVLAALARYQEVMHPCESPTGSVSAARRATGAAVVPRQRQPTPRAASAVA